MRIPTNIMQFEHAMCAPCAHRCVSLRVCPTQEPPPAAAHPDDLPQPEDTQDQGQGQDFDQQHEQDNLSVLKVLSKYQDTIKRLSAELSEVKRERDGVVAQLAEIMQEREATGDMQALREQVSAMEAENGRLRQEVRQLKEWQTSAIRAATVISGLPTA